MQSNSVLQDPEESCSHSHLFNMVRSKWGILEVIIAGVQAESAQSFSTLFCQCVCLHGIQQAKLRAHSFWFPFSSLSMVANGSQCLSGSTNCCAVWKTCLSGIQHEPICVINYLEFLLYHYINSSRCQTDLLLAIGFGLALTFIFIASETLRISFRYLEANPQIHCYLEMPYFSDLKFEELKQHKRNVISQSLK